MPTLKLIIWCRRDTCESFLGMMRKHFCESSTHPHKFSAIHSCYLSCYLVAFLGELCSWVNPQRTSSSVSSECSAAHQYYFNPLHSLLSFVSVTKSSWSFLSFLSMCVFFLADRSFLESPYCQYSLFRTWGIWRRESLFTHLQSYFSKLLDLYVVLASWLFHQEVLK